MPFYSKTHWPMHLTSETITKFIESTVYAQICLHMLIYKASFQLHLHYPCSADQTPKLYKLMQRESEKNHLCLTLISSGRTHLALAEIPVFFCLP